MKSLKTKFKTTVALALALIMIPATAFAAEEGFETGNSSKEVQVTVNGPQLQYKVTLPLAVTMKDVNDFTEDEINAIDSCYTELDVNSFYTTLKNASFAYVGFVPLSVEGNIGAKKLNIDIGDLMELYDRFRNVDTGVTLFYDYKSINNGATDISTPLYQSSLEITASEVAAGYSNSYACMFYMKPVGEGRVMPAGNYRGTASINISLVD